MTSWTLFLQAYVEAPDYERAFGVAAAVIRITEPHATVTECRVSPYDKFETRYGVWLSLEAEDKPAAWQVLQETLAKDWHVGGDETDRHAVWDSRLGGPSPLAEARWLNLELYETDETQPVD